MSHTDIILIITIITFSSTAGIYVAVKKIKQYTRAPENVLTRRGDIELVDYNEPTQPLQAYFQSGADSISTTGGDASIVSPIINESIPYHHPIVSVQNGSILSYQARIDLPVIDSTQTGTTQTGTSLNYQPEINYWINSYLENENILDSIIGIILFLIISLFLIIMLTQDINKPKFFNKKKKNY